MNKQRINSMLKGKTEERRWCKKLDLLLPEYSPWIRDWFGGLNQARGDLVPKRDSESCPFYVECKSRRSVTSWNIKSWWDETLNKAEAIKKKNILLCVHQTDGPWLVLTNARLPAEQLLLAEVLPIYVDFWDVPH